MRKSVQLRDDPWGKPSSNVRFDDVAPLYLVAIVLLLQKAWIQLNIHPWIPIQAFLWGGFFSTPYYMLAVDLQTLQRCVFLPWILVMYFGPAWRAGLCDTYNKNQLACQLGAAWFPASNRACCWSYVRQLGTCMMLVKLVGSSVVVPMVYLFWEWGRL